MSASIISPLVISGSRKADGTANDSGKVWAYLPNTSTSATLYSNPEATAIATQPIILDEGGRVSSADCPDGLFTAIPIRLYVEDAFGDVVSDSLFTPATASTVTVDNDGFPDAATVDDVFTQLFTSTGGTAGKYKESNGATERTIHDKFAEFGVSVKDFGAVGDGIAIDTTAIQNAINEAKVLSCAVLFPDGDYATDQALTLSSATGVSFLGIGTSASRIITRHASANVLTLSSCTGFRIENLLLSATAANSGSAISLASCTTVSMDTVTVSAAGGGTFLIPIVATTCSTLELSNCSLTAKAADATARALKLTACSGVNVFGGFYSGLAGAAMEFATTTSFVNVVAAGFGNVSANIGILWTAAMTGTDFTVVGCPTLRSAAGTVTTPFDLSALTTNPRFRQWGNSVDGYTVDVASAGTATPDLSRGNHIRIRATSTGAAIILAAPIPTPATTMYGVTLILDIFNNAGGALSNPYTVDAVYHLSTVPNQTDLNHNQYLLTWDPNASVWRQLSLSVTT